MKIQLGRRFSRAWQAFWTEEETVLLGKAASWREAAIELVEVHASDGTPIESWPSESDAVDLPRIVPVTPST